MCTQFLIDVPLDEVFVHFGACWWTSENNPELTQKRILPFNSSIVVLQRAGERVVEPMTFSLIPSWSKERRPKFATYNARLETVEQKPTWKIPFLRKRCLVPMTDFIEPIYKGEFAGAMVRFSPRVDQILAASAIYDEWKDPESKELVRSFSILTSEPSEFVRQAGHDRQPIFLHEDGWSAWLQEGVQEGSKLRTLIETWQAEPDLTAAIDRPMKPGWEKRREKNA